MGRTVTDLTCCAVCQQAFTGAYSAALVLVYVTEEVSAAAGRICAHCGCGLGSERHSDRGVAIALFSIYWSIHVWKRQGPVLRVKTLGFTRQFARIDTDEHGQPTYDEDGHPVYRGDQPHVMRTVIWGTIRNAGRFDARAQDAWFILNEVRPWPNPVHWWTTRHRFPRVDVSSGDLHLQGEDSSFPIQLPAQSTIRFEIAVAPDVRDAKPKGPLRGDWELLESWVEAKRPVMLVIRTGAGETIHTRVRYMRPEKLRQAVEEL